MSNYDLRHESLLIDGNEVNLSDLADNEVEMCIICGVIQLKEDISWFNRLCSECANEEEVGC